MTSLPTKLFFFQMTELIADFNLLWLTGLVAFISFQLLKICFKSWHKHSPSRTSERESCWCREFSDWCEDKVISQTCDLNPWKPAGNPFFQPIVKCAVVASLRTLGGLPDGHGIIKKDQNVLRHQWTGPQKRPTSSGTPQQEVKHSQPICAFPVLISVLLHFDPPDINRPTHHRWCSVLGRGRAPSASTEGRHTL